MPIPPFDGILNILPPHISAPGKVENLAPYLCTTAELCHRFATSPERKQILQGFLDLRAKLFRLGIVGFQWLDGSFVEDVEAQRGRAPGDIDVATFIGSPTDSTTLNTMVAANVDVFSHVRSKAVYLVDHFAVALMSHPVYLVQITRYWYGLFSHRKDDGQWKGMLVVELQNPTDDDAARVVLGSKP